MPANEGPGNILRAPDYTPTTYPDDYLVDDELLYSYARFTQKGVTLTPGQGILPIGTVLGRVTSTKLWSVYNNGASDGTEVARGVLRQRVDTGTDAAGAKLQANIVISGILKNDKVSGADANAITDLNARTDSVLNTFTF